MTFTKIVFSSDDYTQSTDSNVASLSALSSLDLTATARAFVDVNGNLKIRGVANNQNTTSAFYIKTYGLYVKNSAGTEMLFAVATAQNANFVPAYNNKQTNQVAYTFNLAISSTSNITLSNQSDVDVTQADIASINSAVNSASSAIASNAQSIQNNGTAITTISNIANQAQATAYQGLRFMGVVPTSSLTQCQTPGIYDLGGKKYDDWNAQLWGNYVVINAGSVTQQFIYNNVNNCWAQSCNGWGNTGFKPIY